jgi:hypothetical protein
MGFENVLGREQKTLLDFSGLQREFELKKQAAAMEMAKSINKSNEIDVDKLGEQAFMKAAMGQELTPQELAAARFVDAKSGGFSFNPVTGAGMQKPRISDKIGLGLGSAGGQQMGMPSQSYPSNNASPDRLSVSDLGGIQPLDMDASGELMFDNNIAPQSQRMPNNGFPPQNQYETMYKEALRNAQGNPKLEQTIKAEYLRDKMSFNENQGAAANYADRMREANEILSNPANTAAGMDMAQVGKSKVPLIGNYLVSKEFQNSDQAKRNFINANLRRESGAVITDSEFANANLQYFPQPGDNEPVLAQKAQNRKSALDGISRAAGPAYVPTNIVDPYKGSGGLTRRQEAEIIRAKRQAERNR